jgi:hypothetical protein
MLGVAAALAVWRPMPPVAKPSFRLTADTVGLVALAAAFTYGLVQRLWILGHTPLFGDEAVAGLMARRIAAGHFSAFYWGQTYGGVEPLVTALLFRLGGSGTTTLNLTPTLLTALAAVFVAAIVWTAGGRRRPALAAGIVVWVSPYAVVWNSVREVGFRYAALSCGLAALFCAVRLQRRRAGPWGFAALGLALGIGWWASPEIVYFIPPCVVLLKGWWRTSGGADEGEAQKTRAERLARAAAPTAGGALLGSIPWWYANIQSGFASLHVPASQGTGGLGYGVRFSVFFHYMLPTQLGLRVVPGAAWVGGTHLGHLLFALAVAVVAACLLRAVWLFRRDAAALTPLALAAGVVAFPFIYAAVPASAYWVDGRYGLFLPFLIVPLVILCSSSTHIRMRPASRAGAGVGLIGITMLTLGAAHTAGIPAPQALFSGWGNPDAPMHHVVDEMAAHHLDFAYGDYWTSYDLEFIGQGRVNVSPTTMDVMRLSSLLAQVRASPDPAWLFFAPGQNAAAVFSNPQAGPGPYDEASFEALLSGRGIHFRVVHLGVLDAVVPAHRVSIP